MKIKPIQQILLLIISCTLSYNAAAQNAACPQNMDFEDGNLDNWEFYTGSCCPITTSPPAPPVPNRHELMSGTGTDFYGGFPVVPPGGGNYALKLGNDQTGAQAEKARYYVRVPSNPNAIYTLLYSYAVVFEDPGHAAIAQPRFEVNVYDSATGTPVPCNQFNFVANSSLPGFQKSTTAPTWQTVLYKPWTTSSIDLSSMAGTTVAIDFSAADCGLGGHFGYAYLDVACNFFQSYDYYCPALTSLTLEAPPGFETYEWWNSNFSLQLGTTKDITVPTPPQSTQYAVILQPYTGFGCPDTLFTNYNIYTMSIDVTIDTAICRGDSVRLASGTNSTKGPFTYSWSPTVGLGCTTCDSPMASPPAFTEYFITVTDNDGCTAVDSVTVRVDERVNTSLVVGDTFCTRESIEIKSDIAPATNPTTTQYRWTLEGGGNVIEGEYTDSITGQWYTSGQKKVKIFAENGRCISRDSAELYINPSPKAEFDVIKDVCVGTHVLLKPYEEEASYFWTIDDHTVTDTIYTGTIHLQWNTIGEKRIFLRTKNKFDCQNIGEDYVGVHSYPDASIKRIDVNDVCYGKQFTLGAPEGDRYRYSWYPPQYFSGNGLPQATGTAERTGHVYLDVINTWGCKTTDSIFINAESCCDIFMPDAFTPDNNGVNDNYWSPDLYKHRLISFMIVNRRGQVVYQTETPGNGWDGTFNGAPLGMDTYHYYIKYLCKEDEIVEKKGNFILMR